MISPDTYPISLKTWIVKCPFGKNLSAQGFISRMKLYEAIIFSTAKIIS